MASELLHAWCNHQRMVAREAVCGRRLSSIGIEGPRVWGNWGWQAEDVVVVLEVRSIGAIVELSNVDPLSS